LVATAADCDDDEVDQFSIDFSVVVLLAAAPNESEPRV
jgi:hypothetical protein